VTRPTKPIRLSGHARDQLAFRGGTEREVVEAIRTVPWQPAELSRLECRKDFAFNAVWNKRHVDALYIRFKEATVTTKHVAEGIAADYDADGYLAGIEILDAMKRLGDPTVFKQIILEDIALGKT
jgi:uncharacterized protein YuzE